MNMFSVSSRRILSVMQRITSRRLGIAGLAAAAILFAAGPTQASLVYNTGLADPPGTYYGTNNPNTNWVVDTANGVEIGLQTLIRYTGSVVPIPTDSSIYYVPLGPTTVPGKSGSAWGFAFSLNLGSNSGLVLNDVTTSLQMQDVANSTFGGFDALAIGDNTGYDSGGKDTPMDPTRDYGFQNAEALSYPSIAVAGFGDSAYNMYQNDTYNFTFSVTCSDSACGGAGTQLASVNSTVIAGSGAPPVPEPATFGLFGAGLLGLLGLATFWRRREDLPGTPAA